MEFDLDIIGPYPPPYGGISIHVSRILPLIRQSGLSVRVFNHYFFQNEDIGVFATKKSYFWWAKYFFKAKSNIIHIHQFSWFHFPYAFLLSRIKRSRVVVTIHNEKLLSSPSLLRMLVFWLLRHAKLAQVICVSRALTQDMKARGVKNSIWLSAYVPPLPVTKRPLQGCFQKNVVFNAWRIDSKHLFVMYGFDLLLAIAEDNPSVGFHVFIGDPNSRRFLDDFLSESDVKNVFIFYGESLVDFLPHADLFVRLNRNDAYGVSIKEAMDLGVPALASNVCVRPEGSILFDVSDFSDLCSKFSYAINEDAAVLLKDCKPSVDHLVLLEIYKDLLGALGNK